MLETGTAARHEAQIVDLAPPPVTTPYQKSVALRKEIEYHVRRWCAQNKERLEIYGCEKNVNREIVKHFGKSRKSMSARELQEVSPWLVENYPLDA